MTLLLDQALPGNVVRTYHIQIPSNPSQAVLPVILVFHGGGQDVATIAARWGVNPPDPVPPDLDDYLLVFPEADPTLPDEWVHFGTGDSAFPTHDLDFVRQLLQELTTRAYDTGSPDVPTVSADPSLAYAAGFSNGAGLTWQLLHSGRTSAPPPAPERSPPRRNPAAPRRHRRPAPARRRPARPCQPWHPHSGPTRTVGTSGPPPSCSGSRAARTNPTGPEARRAANRMHSREAASSH